MIELLPLVTCIALVLLWLRVEKIAAAVFHIDEQIEYLRRELGIAPRLSPDPSELVRQLALDPKKTVEAIKTYREESGTDLKNAKQVVDQLRAARGDA